MKKTVLLLLIATFILGCNPKEKSIKVDEATEVAQINTVLDSWHLNAAETNFDAYFGAMSANSIFVGTDAAEVWNIKEFKAFSKPYFDKGTAWSFTPLNRNVYLDTDAKIAWFDEILDTWMGICRGSGVLKKTGNTWKIEHYVLSLTIPNENIQQIKAINKAKDSLFLKQLKN